MILYYWIGTRSLALTGRDGTLGRARAFDCRRRRRRSGRLSSIQSRDEHNLRNNSSEFEEGVLLFK